MLLHGIAKAFVHGAMVWTEIKLCNDAHFSCACQIKYNPHFADRAPGLQSRVFLCRHLGGRNRRGTACPSLEAKPWHLFLTTFD